MMVNGRWVAAVLPSVLAMPSVCRRKRRLEGALLVFFGSLSNASERRIEEQFVRRVARYVCAPFAYTELLICLLLIVVTVANSGAIVVQPLRIDASPQLSLSHDPFCSTLRRRRQRPLHGSLPANHPTTPRTERISWDPFEACWTTTSQDVNPHASAEIDCILQSLHSPAPQSFFVIQRAIKQTLDQATEREHPQLESIVEQQLCRCSYLLKPGRRFVLRKGQSFALLDSTTNGDGGSALCWGAGHTADQVSDGWRRVDVARKELSVVALASEALDLVLDASERTEDMISAELERIVASIRTRLQLTLGTDVRGRASSDAAYTLSLAGVVDDSLYDALLYVSVLEMRRLGRRPSKTAKDYLHIVEKVAASGAIRFRNERLGELYALAALGLASKGDAPHSMARVLSDESARFDLLSPRPMLWLWRYSSRLTKPQSGGEDTKESDSSFPCFDWDEVFRNSSLPLVVDVGCGLGTSLLGLASTSGCEQQLPSCLGDLDLPKCNFLGGDLNTASLRYGSGIAKRWNLTSTLSFMALPADSLLEGILNGYEGRVALILIQFPTPYRLDVEESVSGNSQLPVGINEGFMVSNSVMSKVAALLRKSKGYLMIQTNCEDVALALRDRALEHSLSVVPADSPVTLASQTLQPNTPLPERTIEWVRSGGDRAIGSDWWSGPIMPPRCASETEVACLLQGTPVHRCLLTVKG
jgi:SAM-dependent methyltransferase